MDDELNALMVRPLLPGVTLHAVIDACHSGTALDLPYRAKVDGAGRWYWKGRHTPNKATRGGEAGEEREEQEDGRTGCRRGTLAVGWGLCLGEYDGWRGWR